MKTLLAILLAGIAVHGNCQVISFTPAPASPITTTSSLKGLTAADLNLDGHVDIVACPAYYNMLFILLGNGSGQFSPATGSPFQLGSGPMAAAVADFNGDGKPDLATANYLAGNVSVLLGNGSGSFVHATGSPISTAANPYFVEAADFNLDGNMDLISTSVGGSAVYLHHGQGNGTFSLAPGFPLSAPGMPYHVTSGHFNNDIYPDFVVLDHNAAQAKVYLGSTSGSFAAAPGSPFSTPTQPRTIMKSDFNNDGRNDLVVACASSSAVSIYLGSPSGSFAVAPGSPVNMGMQTYMSAIADFDLDGKNDLVISGVNDAVLVLRGAGNGSFSVSGNSLAVGYVPQPICTADFDEDGRPDFAVGDFLGNEVNVLLNSACNLTGNITYTIGSGGQVAFTAAASATAAATTYSWHFGGGATGTGTSSAHTFVSGVHTVTLLINNHFQASPCIYSTTTTFTVENCALSGGIVHTVGVNGAVSFSAAVTGSVPGTTYHWNFGPGTASGTTSSYTFQPGAYVVTLTANNNSQNAPCIGTFTTSVIIEDYTIGVSEHDISRSLIFPNPASSEVQVGRKGVIQGCLIVYDNLGKTVMDLTVESGQVITVADLPGGVYQYRIYNGNIVVSRGQLAILR